MLFKIEKHDGMSVKIAPEKLPEYMYQLLENVDLSKKAGRIVRRDGYSFLFSSIFTNITGMAEFIDNNNTRRLVICDSGVLKISTVTDGSYGAFTVLTSVGDIEWFMPVIQEGVIRSGNYTAYYPFWIGYIGARSRYNSGETMSAGLYSEKQVYDFNDIKAQFEIDKVFTGTGGTGTGYFETSYTGVGAEAGIYRIYISPVLDERQKSFPIEYADYSLQANAAMSLLLKVDKGLTGDSLLRRITAFDVFLAKTNIGNPGDLDISPGYFLERVDMNDQGREVIKIGAGNTLTGITFQAATPPTYVEFNDNFANWETFRLSNFVLEFTYSSVNYRIYLGNRTTSTTKVRYAITELESVSLNALNGVSINDATITPQWVDGNDVSDLTDGSWYYPIKFDNVYKKLGAEMYAYLNIPIGDFGLGDLNLVDYEFSLISNNRYVIFLKESKHYIYYSKAGEYDVIPSQNIISPGVRPVAAADIGGNLFVFGESSTERYQIVDNTVVYQDDKFANIGCVNRNAVAVISDDTVYGFDYRGPWVLAGGTIRFIGQHLNHYWTDVLTNAQKSQCTVVYSRHKNQVWYNFSTYGGSVFVYDIDAQNSGMLSPWSIMTTDIKMKYGITGQYLFTIISGKNDSDDEKLIIFNNNEGDEEVRWKIRLRVFQNPLNGKMIRLNRAYIDWYSDGADVITVKFYPDVRDDESGRAAAAVTLSIKADKQMIIKYLCETFDIEITDSDDPGALEFSSIVFDLDNKRLR